MVGIWFKVIKLSEPLQNVYIFSVREEKRRLCSEFDVYLFELIVNLSIKPIQLVYLKLSQPQCATNSIL